MNSWVTRSLAIAIFSFPLGWLNRPSCLNGQEKSFDRKGVPLAGTSPLEMTGDIASQMIDGIDRFLLKKIEASIEQRMQRWPKPQGANLDYATALAELRKELTQRIGMVDPRESSSALTVQSRIGSSPAIGETEDCEIFSIRWKVFESVEAEGLLVKPKKGEIRFTGVLIPDASQVPETLCGEGADSSHTALELASRGGVIVIPHVISRHREARNGRAKMTDQEFVYRAAFELGRHMLGYQVQEALAAVDLLKREYSGKPTGIAGWGEGGWIALHAAAVDPRIDVACVSGHFGSRESTWKEPIHRNIHGLLLGFGDAQLAALIAPRILIIDAAEGPVVDLPSEGGAPGVLSGPGKESVIAEYRKAQQLLMPWKLDRSILLIDEDASNATSSSIRMKAIGSFAEKLNADRIAPFAKKVTWHRELESVESRRLRTVAKWDRWNQWLLEHVGNERAAYWKLLDTKSLASFESSVEKYREHFRKDVIGAWDDKPLPSNPKTRKVYEKETWDGYEVVLDLFPEIFAYGVLLVPKGIQKGEKRPCVVFQHGLEGRPVDIIEGDHAAYHDVAAKLAEKGYVVFAPQNCYLFKDRFRSLQRKSNLVGRTLFSTINAQHQQLVDWLGSLPEVDQSRIGFYGLSYGGKSAMRIPALVQGYALSICSADFNDWIWKNASTNSNYSYMWTGEYEIFEFGLGPTFNYAEMAWLIAPRPFMVERGHFDGVAPDERVAAEFARVYHLYSAKLGIGDRAELEWFVGPHTIHGKGTFQFLDKHLKHQSK